MAKQTFGGRLVRIYCSESDEWQGRRLYQAIVELASEAGLMAATVYRGLEGFGESAALHRSSFWSFGKNDAPIVVTLVDRAEALDRFLPRLDGLLSDGLIASSEVEVTLFVAGDAASTGKVV